jgi:hypothetical protein
LFVLYFSDTIVEQGIATRLLLTRISWRIRQQ